MFVYKNRNTGDVYSFSERHAELDALSNWELIEGADVPELSRIAVDRAEAERASIEEAQRHRLDHTLAANDGAANEEGARSQSRASAPSATTPSHSAPAPAGVPVPVLSNPDLKIGGLHGGPTSKEAVEEMARQQALDPPQGGVLARAKADHRAGATQIGDNPEIHRQIRAGLRPDRAAAAIPGTERKGADDGKADGKAGGKAGKSAESQPVPGTEAERKATGTSAEGTDDAGGTGPSVDAPDDTPKAKRRATKAAGRVAKATGAARTSG